MDQISSSLPGQNRTMPGRFFTSSPSCAPLRRRYSLVTRVSAATFNRQRSSSRSLIRALASAESASTVTQELSSNSPCTCREKGISLCAEATRSEPPGM